MFYLATFQRFLDGTPTAASLLGYNTQDAATIALYSTMASSMDNNNISSIMCMIINENGIVVRVERWERTPEAVEE